MRGSERGVVRVLLAAWAIVSVGSIQAAAPMDNPVARHFAGDEGYPAWTDGIRWTNVIDMKAYARGKTDFEKFENARDELAVKGGGVLYYPAGSYDFTSMPADGPNGRGLMLRGGVVIRGDTPAGKPLARNGKLELPTRFEFGFRKRGGGQVPRDWNLIGLKPEPGKRVKDVNDVGVAWVHLIGGVIYFGPDVEWGKTWSSAGSWMSGRVKETWKDRVPDGTHPFDPFAGGGKDYVGLGRGRLVFGCVLEDAAVLDDFLDPGYGPNGFHTQRFGARIGVYGSRVLVANNLLPKSGRNFKYVQKTRPPKGMPQDSAILFDYGKTSGIDVNKDLLGWARAEGNCPGYFAEGVVVRDNHVWNHGHKGYNLSGAWVTIAGNHNERTFLRQGDDVYGLGGDWVLTLDGWSVTGGASDNLARAFDLAGRNLWIDRNTFNNTGSFPGNDGEGILCQLHGGTHIWSWAITHNVHTRGNGLPSYLGGWDVHCHGLLILHNETAGWVGNAVIRKTTKMADCAFVANKCQKVLPDEAAMKKHGIALPLSMDPPGVPSAPRDTKAEVYDQDGVKITWTDTAKNDIGFRVDRRIDDGQWTAIAYRPGRLEGDPGNPQAWIDFTAPPGKALRYRVAAIQSDDSVRSMSPPTPPVTLPRRLNTGGPAPR